MAASSPARAASWAATPAATAATAATGQPPPPAADAILVAAARGDPRAFEPLFVRYWDAVLRYCFYRLADREEAEDAASQIFADAYFALDRFRDRGDSFRAWLFAIAHHEVANRRRYRARHPAAALATAGDLPDPAPSPEAAAVVAGDAARTLALLADLPERSRQVTELRLAGLADREIAAVLGVSGAAVRQAQRRAVLRLRVLLRVGTDGVAAAGVVPSAAAGAPAGSRDGTQLGRIGDAAGGPASRDAGKRDCDG